MLVFVAFGVESGIDNAIISNVKIISQGTMNNSDGSTVDISGYITSVEPIRYGGINNFCCYCCCEHLCTSIDCYNHCVHFVFHFPVVCLS